MLFAARPSSRDKLRSHHERLRAQGLRLIQIWVPDTRAAGFRAAARNQTWTVTASQQEADDQRFIDALSSEN